MSAEPTDGAHVEWGIQDQQGVIHNYGADEQAARGLANRYGTLVFRVIGAWSPA